MSQTFLQDAKAQFPNKVHQEVPTQVKYCNSIQTKGEFGDTVYVNSESYASELQADALVSVQPITAIPANVLNTGGIVDIRPQQGIIDRATFLYIRMDMTNSSGASITLAPAQAWINYIQVFGQAGSDLLYQQYGTELWIENSIAYNYAQWLQIAPLLGSNSTYNSTTGFVVANGATQTAYIPIITMFASSKLFLAGLNAEILIRTYFNSSALSMITPGTMTINNIQLLIHGVYLPESERQVKMKMYKQMNLDFPYLSVTRANQTLTLAVSSSYTVVLSGLNGLMSSFYFVFRALPITSSTLFSFSNIVNTYDLQNNSGQSLLGYYQRTNGSTTGIDDTSLVYLINGNDNVFFQNSNLTPVWFNRMEGKSLSTGSSGGFCASNGFLKFYFTTLSSITPGNYQLDIYCRAWQTLMIRKGNMTSTQ